MAGEENSHIGICDREADFSTSAASAPPPVEMTTIFPRPEIREIRFDSLDGARCDAVSDGWLCQSDYATGPEEEEEKKREGCEGEDVSDGLVHGLSVGDADDGGTGGDGEGDQADVSLEVIGGRSSVE